MLSTTQKQERIEVCDAPEEMACDSVPVEEVERNPGSAQTAPTRDPWWAKLTPHQFSLGLAMLFFALGLLGIAHHEISRTEYLAWAIARSSVDLPQLLNTMSLAGGPFPWHIFLWVITAFTNNPFAMQLFHLSVASGAIFLMARFSPFSGVEKILLAFGFVPFYEHGIISQGYSLSSLLLFGLAAACNGRGRYKLPAVLLSLLVCTTVFGAPALSYYGQLFMLLIALLWLVIGTRESESKKTILQSKPVAAVFVAMLFLHFLVGMHVYLRDLQEEFSPLQRIARFIQKHNLTETPVFVIPDRCATGFTTVADNPVYSLSTGRALRFESADKNHCDWVIVAIRGVQYSHKWKQPVLVLSSSRLVGLPPTFPFKEIARFRNSQKPDESRFLYVAGPTNAWLHKHFSTGDSSP